MNVKTSVLYNKISIFQCFTSQKFLFCSFAIFMSKAVTESGKSGNSKNWSAEKWENGDQSRKLKENKQNLFIGP